MSLVKSNGSLDLDAGEAKSGLLWTGRAISALPVLALALSASMKLSHSPQVVGLFVEKLGYHEGALLPLGLLELACTLLYLIPRTRTLGALLLTAYLGGAVATHVRIGDPFAIPVILGILVWVGLWLRDPRIRSLATTGPTAS